MVMKERGGREGGALDLPNAGVRSYICPRQLAATPLDHVRTAKWCSCVCLFVVVCCFCVSAGSLPLVVVIVSDNLMV